MPTSVNDWRSPQISADPNVSAIFGHVFAGAASIEQARPQDACARCPPTASTTRAFVAELVRPDEAAWKREAAIEIGEARGDVRVHAVPHDAAALVLVEPEQQRQSQERSRLRAAFAQSRA